VTDLCLPPNPVASADVVPSAPAERGADARRRRTKPIRVVLVGPSLEILGGQAVQLQRLLGRLRENEALEVDFIPINPRLPGALDNLRRIKYVRTVVQTTAYVALLLRRVPRYDVVHAFSASYASFLISPVPSLIVARLYGRRTVLNYRSGEAEDHLARSPLARTLIRRLVDAVVTPSNFLVDVFARFGLKARSIHNFVEIERIPYRRRVAPRPVFLSNRNLEPMYNVGCVLRAFATIQERLPDASLMVAGDGAEGARLRSLAAELGLRNVEFLGRVSPKEMPALYDRADVFLNSPDIDNMPNSIIEAYAAGLPVVTTDAGGIPYIADHERTALLVPRNDHVALGRAALRLFDEPDLALRLADAGRAECLDRYVWPAVGARWEALYEELVASPSTLQHGDLVCD
jgi:glycosyltransferase involved in cell wall biosynthesis